MSFYNSIVKPIFLILILLLFVACEDTKKVEDDTEKFQSYHIVVIGSSTAEGIGPDYSWVDRFRDQLKWIDTGHKVTNLAKGGYNSFNYLPDGTEISNNQTIDSERNITKAISFNPDFIVLNNPSNDIWLEDYNVDTLFDNYQIIINEAEKANIPLYITSSQPTLYEENERNRLIEIESRSRAEFYDNLIDFWSNLSNEDGSTIEKYRTNDNVHLNDAAHYIFAKRVLEKLPLKLAKAKTEKTIHYYSEWSEVNLHYLDDNELWTLSPGISMKREDGNWFTITIKDEGRVFMVFNNGSDWDNNNDNNYSSTLKELWVKDSVIYDEKP